MNIKTLFFLILLALLHLACSDNVSLYHNDIKKYIWLAPFIDDTVFVFYKGTHNTDIGTMDIFYKIQDDNINTIADKLDSIANAKNWKILGKNEFHRIYSKQIPTNQIDSTITIINFKINTLKKELIIHIE